MRTEAIQKHIVFGDRSRDSIPHTTPVILTGIFPIYFEIILVYLRFYFEDIKMHTNTKKVINTLIDWYVSVSTIPAEYEAYRGTPFAELMMQQGLKDMALQTIRCIAAFVFDGFVTTPKDIQGVPLDEDNFNELLKYIHSFPFADADYVWSRIQLDKDSRFAFTLLRLGAHPDDFSPEIVRQFKEKYNHESWDILVELQENPNSLLYSLDLESAPFKQLKDEVIKAEFESKQQLIEEKHIASRDADSSPKRVRLS